MFEKFLSANAADFRQRYEGTFGFYRDENGKRLLTKLSHIREDVCIFTDARDVEYRLNPNAEKNIGFEFIPPRAAFYNVVDGAALVCRVAARQFQRGLSSKNTGIYLLNGNLRQQRVGFPMLTKIYLQAIPPRMAYANWNALPSVAITKQLACSEGRLYMFENVIGSYTKEGDHFKVALDEPDLWRTEIQDGFKSIGCTVEVS